METVKFKTNINCGGCVANVTPFLNAEKRISSWSVDTSTPDKIITINAEDISEEELKDIIKKAGYIVKE